MARNNPKPATNSHHELGARSYGLISVLVVMFLAERVGRNWLPQNVWFKTLFVAVFLGLAYALIRSVMADRRQNQRFRDQMVAAGLDGRYGVFLRPFHLDSTLKLENPFFRFWSGNYAEVFPLFPGEYVSRVLEPFFRVVEIGGTETTIGSSRVHSGDAQWQQMFYATLEGACFVVIMPLLFEKAGQRHGEATLWELAQLAATSDLDRVVVFMPRTPGLRSALVSRAWESARAAAAIQGVDLPAYSRHGGVFTLFEQNARWRPSIDRASGRYRGRALAAGLIEAVQHVTGPR